MIGFFFARTCDAFSGIRVALNPVIKTEFRRCTLNIKLDFGCTKAYYRVFELILIYFEDLVGQLKTTFRL